MRAGTGVLVAAACLAGGLAVPATAAPPVLGAYTTLTGTTTATVRVTVPRDALVSADFQERPDVAVRSDAPVAGFVLQRVGAGAGAGLVGLRLPGGRGVLLTRMGGTGGTAFSTSGLLPAGSYLLTLVTTRPATVRFRLPGLTGPERRLAPTGRTPASVQTFAPTVPGVPFAAGASFRVTRAALGYALLWADGPASAATAVMGCIYQGRPPGGSVLPGCPGAFSTMSTTIGVRTPYRVTEGAYFNPVGAGEWTVGVSDAGAAVTTTAGALVVWVEHGQA